MRTAGSSRPMPAAGTHRPTGPVAADRAVYRGAQRLVGRAAFERHGEVASGVVLRRVLRDLPASPRRTPTALRQGLSDTIALKPPQNMRLASNGIVFGSMSFMRGSAITFLLTESRCLRDL